VGIDVYKLLEENKDKIKDYDKVRRHLGKKVEFRVKNENEEVDSFYFNPISYELYLEFTAMANTFKEEQSPEAMKASFDFIKKIIMESYPDWPEEVAKQFLADHLDGMMNVLEQLLPATMKDVKDMKTIQRKINAMRNMQNATANNSSPGTPEPSIQPTE
jgi:hypothetical protein